jgi:hypothetical protein
MSTRRVATCLLVVTTVLVTLPARADDTAVAPDAHAHFQNGIDAVQRGDFQRAAREFEAAEALSPNPVVLYNLGAAYSALGLPVQAEQALQQYLDQPPQADDPERPEEAKRLLEFNRQRIGAALIDVVPADTALQVDGLPVTLPASGRVRLAAGRHVVVATHAGYKPTIVNVDVVARAEVPLALALEPEVRAEVAAPLHGEPPPPTSVAVQPGPIPRASERTRVSKTGVIALTVAGVGGAAMVASFFVGLRVESLKADSNRGHCDARGCDAEGLELRRVAMSDGNWATGLFIGGAVAAAAGLTVYFLRGREPASSLTALRVSPELGPARSAGLRLAFGF